MVMAQPAAPSIFTTFRPMTRLATTILGIAALSTSLGGCNRNVDDSDIKSISITEIRSALDNKKSDSILFIDSRPPRAYAAEHIPDAINMQITAVDINTQYMKRDSRLERYGVLVVYGDDPGTPSAKALTKRLIFVGYDDVRMYFDGLGGWKRAGWPTEGTGPAAVDPTPQTTIPPSR